MVESDIKLRKAFVDGYGWTVTPNSDTCSKRFDIQSIVTHEAGHLFGLNHVTGSAHTGLTMGVGGAGPVLCKSPLRTVGLGDYRGMRALYGHNRAAM